MKYFALLFLSLSTLAASVAEWVDRMPTFGPDARFEGPAWDKATVIFDEILAGGDAAILEVINLINEPVKTPDSKARNVLHGMAQYLASDGKEQLRGRFLTVMASAVANENRPESVRGFLWQQMHLCGGSSALRLAGTSVAETRAILRFLGGIHTPESLAAVRPFIDVPKLAGDAGGAVIDIARHLGKDYREMVREAVSEALIVASDRQREAGEKLLEEIGGELEPPASKLYLGRQPAQTMHWMGADWLLRAVREREEATSVMIRALELQPGQVVADLGCGNGYHSLIMARLVGETGKIYGVDIQPEMLTMLKKRAADANVANVVPVLGKYWDPNLPANSIDVALIVDAYHEFSHPARMLKGIYKALKANGVVVFLEYRMEDPQVPIKKLHKMSKAQVNKELTANGFKLVKSFDELPWQHMLWYGKE